jgi:Tetratricopeptide repeat
MSPQFDWFQAVLSAVLITFSTAGILLDSAYRNNPAAETALCRFDVCATGQLLNRANLRAFEPDRPAAQLAAVDYREALRRDMSYPYRWCDLGEACWRSGRIEEAQYCFSRAVDLAPDSPPILMRAANFQFRAGHPAKALPYTLRILKLIGDYDSLIFLNYARAELPPEQTLREGLPEESRAVRSYFEFALANGSPESAAQIWEWMRLRSFTDDRLAGRYIDFLLRNRRYGEAARMWEGYLGPRRGPYPETNLLFNGGFETESSGAAFDWTAGKTEHVGELRDSSVTQSGKWSLRVSFDGAANVEYQGVSQTAVVSPGTYRFAAAVRTAGVTTNQGIAFRLFDPESPARLDVRTAAFTGTSEWVSLTKDVRVGALTHLVKIQLFRQPSEKFDSKISGRAWIDSVALTPLPR